jgi:hypothetical protein
MNNILQHTLFGRSFLKGFLLRILILFIIIIVPIIGAVITGNIFLSYILALLILGSIFLLYRLYNTPAHVDVNNRLDNYHKILQSLYKNFDNKTQRVIDKMNSLDKLTYLLEKRMEELENRNSKLYDIMQEGFANYNTLKTTSRSPAVNYIIDMISQQVVAQTHFADELYRLYGKISIERGIDIQTIENINLLFNQSQSTVLNLSMLIFLTESDPELKILTPKIEKLLSQMTDDQRKFLKMFNSFRK